MPRNGSGSMSIPNVFSSGAPISSSSMNANFTDVASELTNSVAKDGQTSMTGPLKAATGSISAPSLAFASDADTGFYRKSSGNIGIVSDGVEVGTFSSTGLTSAAGTQITGFASGTVMMFVQTAAPTGWTKSTDHNDKTLRVVSGTASSGGSSAFSSVFAARTITQANLPNVTLTGTTNTTGAHTHTYTGPSNSAGGDGGASVVEQQVTNNTSSNGDHSHTVSVSLGGSGTAVDFAVQYVDVIIATKD